MKLLSEQYVTETFKPLKTIHPSIHPSSYDCLIFHVCELQAIDATSSLKGWRVSATHISLAIECQGRA